MASEFLRLLIYLLVILIPACASSSPAFFMIYSAYKLNRQSDNVQPWHASFPIWIHSVVPCPVVIINIFPYSNMLPRWLNSDSLLPSLWVICIFLLPKGKSLSNFDGKKHRIPGIKHLSTFIILVTILMTFFLPIVQLNVYIT